MGWLIALAVIVCIGLLPLGISARYDEKGAAAALIAGPVRVRIYPKKADGKPKKEKAQKEVSTKSQKAQAADKGSATQGGSFRDFLPLVQLVLDFLRAFGTKLRVNRLEIKLIMAADDPSDLAVNYGRAWAVLGNVMPHLERVFVIKKRDLQVECDFAADDTLIFARLDLTITVARLLHVSVFHGLRVIYHYLKIINQRKGGAKS